MKAFIDRLEVPEETFWYKHPNYQGFVAVAGKLFKKKRLRKQCFL